VLRLYVRVRGVSSVPVGVLGGIQDGSLDVEGARFRITSAEDEDQVLPAERLRHEFPSLAGLGVAAEGSFHQRRRVEFGFHGFHQVFGGVLRAAQARLFFFDFADLAVDLVARGFRKGIEKFPEAFGLAEFTGEQRVDGNGKGNLTMDVANSVFSLILVQRHLVHTEVNTEKGRDETNCIFPGTGFTYCKARYFCSKRCLTKRRDQCGEDT